MSEPFEIVEANLLSVLDEIKGQPEVGKRFPPETLGFPKCIERLREWIEDANECGLAFELMVAMLKGYPFTLSGSAVVKLLEAGMLMEMKLENIQA